MKHFLVPLQPGLCVVPIEKPVVLIGRQSDCDVSLTLSRKVSRRHCCIAQVDEQIVARDLGSTNGIYVNGERVKRQCRVNLGDELMIGDVRFRLQNTPTPPQKIKSAAPSAKAAQHVANHVTPPASPGRVLSSHAVPSEEYPVALPDEGRDFAVEASIPRMQPVPRASLKADDGPPVLGTLPLEAEEESDVPRIIPMPVVDGSLSIS